MILHACQNKPARFDKVHLSSPKFFKVDQIPPKIKNILIKYGFYDGVKKYSTNIVFLSRPERTPNIIDDQLATIDYHSKTIFIKRSSFDDLHPIENAAVLLHEADHLRTQHSLSSYKDGERITYAFERTFFEALNNNPEDFSEAERNYIKKMISFLNNAISQDNFKNPPPKAPGG